MVLTFNIVILAQMQDALLWVPFVSNAGTALFAVIRADYMLLAREITYLLLVLGTGFMVLLATIRIVEPRPVGR